MVESFFSLALQDLLLEAVVGIKEGSKGTWFVEGSEGVLHAIRDLSASDASKQIGTASSIAAHTRHMAYYMELTNDYLDGNAQEDDWPKSWEIQSVDDAQWMAIKGDLSRQVDRLLVHMGHLTGAEDQSMMTGAIAQVAHAAYHLGCINQMLRVIGAV